VVKPNIEYSKIVTVSPLPKSAAIAAVEVQINKLGLRSASVTYLRDHHGVDTIDDLLEREKVFDYVKAMNEIVKTFVGSKNA